ncbi:hypothetical protein QFZ28_000455 [Neobacillus niacini]|nr:hypothetical protein [Neobacillus niacini]
MPSIGVRLQKELSWQPNFSKNCNENSVSLIIKKNNYEIDPGGKK